MDGARGTLTINLTDLLSCHPSHRLGPILKEVSEITAMCAVDQRWRSWSQQSDQSWYARHQQSDQGWCARNQQSSFEPCRTAVPRSRLAAARCRTWWEQHYGVSYGTAAPAGQCTEAEGLRVLQVKATGTTPPLADRDSKGPGAEASDECV